LACNAFAEEISLSKYEKSIYSNHGEDGILAKIFQSIKPSYRFCLELGAGDGISGSATYLLRKQAWNALLLDRSHESAEIHLFREFITGENINDLLETYAVPLDMGLMVIRHGYNDFYLWRAIDPAYSPDVVVIGYNATLSPLEDKVVKYRPFYCGDGTDYFGASILAMYRLGREKGYSLVYADHAGSLLFFIRDDILQDKGLSFKEMNQVENLYRTVKVQEPRHDPKNRPYVSSELQ